MTNVMVLAADRSSQQAPGPSLLYPLDLESDQLAGDVAEEPLADADQHVAPGKE